MRTVGIILAVASLDVTQAIKNNPMPTVEGKVSRIPAVFLLDFSARNDSIATNTPPTKNDTNN